MRGRRTTPLAELLQLEAIPRVGLVLRGDVVAPLARLACECDRRSLVTCHVRFFLFYSFQPAIRHELWTVDCGLWTLIR